MTTRLQSIMLGFVVAATAALTSACGEVETGQEGIGEVEQEAGGNQISEGSKLFNNKHVGTLGGNGRLCRSCHPSDNSQSGTLSPADVEALFQSEPGNVLFQHDAADTVGGSTFERIRTHATILIEKDLPPNVTVDGTGDRSVILARGIPTTKNTPRLDPVLMYDGREPDLPTQAQGALLRHAQTSAVTDSQLQAIAAYQRTLFNRQNLEFFVDFGTPITMPLGETESQIRGRRFFIADGQTNPDQVGESFGARCGWCHSGPMLNGLSKFFADNIATPRAGFPVPEGFRFFTAGVSEINSMGNTVHQFDFQLPDGSTATVFSPDPGVALVNGNPGTADFFKIPTVWGSADTAPYFHDNSAKNFDDLLQQYQILFAFLGLPPLSDQDVEDIIAYTQIL